ncbi:DUF5067 domain-containing protein [Leucobacter sp. cx-328]|nr:MULTISPECIES: DUF5067 domain-containing protein [unclassified Leucobacter]MBC9943125.1 DUF5067 domain-containing protein [Leucobacter sp. cx-328]
MSARTGGGTGANQPAPQRCDHRCRRPDRPLSHWLHGFQGDSRDGEHSVIETEVPTEAGPTSYSDRTLISSRTTIAITESRVIPGERGAFLVVSNDLTNTSAEVLDALTAWLNHFRAVQETGAEAPTELTLAALPDEQVAAGAEAAEGAEIPAGETASSTIAYTLAAPEADVALIVSDAGLVEIGRETLSVR